MQTQDTTKRLDNDYVAEPFFCSIKPVDLTDDDKVLYDELQAVQSACDPSINQPEQQ